MNPRELFAEGFQRLAEIIRPALGETGPETVPERSPERRPGTPARPFPGRAWASTHPSQAEPSKKEDYDVRHTP